VGIDYWQSKNKKRSAASALAAERFLFLLP